MWMWLWIGLSGGFCEIVNKTSCSKEGGSFVDSIMKGCPAQTYIWRTFHRIGIATIVLLISSRRPQHEHVSKDTDLFWFLCSQ
jgi:hypothetical protein